MATKKKARPAARRSPASEREALLTQALLSLANAQQAMASTMQAAMGAGPAGPQTMVAPSGGGDFVHVGPLKFNEDGSPFVDSPTEGPVPFSDFEVEGKQFELTFTLSGDVISARSSEDAEFISNLQNYLSDRCHVEVICKAQCSVKPPPPPPPPRKPRPDKRR